jgi:MFS family permease
VRAARADVRSELESAWTDLQAAARVLQSVANTSTIFDSDATFVEQAARAGQFDATTRTHKRCAAWKNRDGASTRPFESSESHARRGSEEPPASHHPSGSRNSPAHSQPVTTPESPLPPTRTLRALPGGIWALGFGSLFMDASSELVHSLLPVFMTSVLGASMVTIGLVEGVAEATASITKVFSGALSDHLGKRKWILVSGYGLGAMSKPLFPLATSVTWVFVGRFVDRIGKGIRGAPRDALVADITPPTLRGAAYGLRQALDSVGAFVGPLLAVVLMQSMANDIKAVLWAAVVPAVIAAVLLMVAIREPEHPAGAAPGERVRLTVADVRRLPRAFWGIVLLGAVFTLSRFSEAFLVLRAQNVGLAMGYVPTVMIAMNIAYAGVAYPAGKAADRLSPRLLLVVGLGILIVADLMLAVAMTPALVFAGTACWGVHMGLTQGLLSKLVADTSAAKLRGTAFGIFNIVSGGALLVASVIAGSLWSAIGPSATFMAGGIFAVVTAIGLLAYRPAKGGV